MAQPAQCAVGTYSSSLGNVDATACLPCTGGSYCSVAGLSAVSGQCKAGYYCSGGSSTSQPLSPSSAGSGDLCTTGHYCPKGSIQPQKCPLGSYMPTVGAGNCTACTAGKYCGVIGLTAVSGSCAAGNQHRLYLSHLINSSHRNPLLSIIFSDIPYPGSWLTHTLS